jgi:hypothetical protein
LAVSLRTASRVVAAFAGDFFDQGDHFLGVSLPNYL